MTYSLNLNLKEAVQMLYLFLLTTSETGTALDMLFHVTLKFVKGCVNSTFDWCHI